MDAIPAAAVAFPALWLFILGVVVFVVLAGTVFAALSVSRIASRLAVAAGLVP